MSGAIPMHEINQSLQEACNVRSIAALPAAILRLQSTNTHTIGGVALSNPSASKCTTPDLTTDVQSITPFQKSTAVVHSVFALSMQRFEQP